MSHATQDKSTQTDNELYEEIKRLKRIISSLQPTNIEDAPLACVRCAHRTLCKELSNYQVCIDQYGKLL